jgi:uncharacterized protein (DUF2344 family)
MLLCYNHHFPQKKVNCKKIKKMQWITKGIKISAERKRILHFQAKHCNNVNLKKYVSQYKKVFKSVVSEAKRMSNCKYIKNSKNKVKATWSVVNNEIGIVKRREKTINLEVDNVVLNKPNDVVNSLNTHFSDIRNY